jgi:hypothetical protein
MEGGAFHLLTTDNTHGAGLLWTSGDGINFGKPVPGYARMEVYLPKAQVDAATNYRDRKFERPQLLIEDGVPTYLYLAGGANILRGDGSCSYVFRVNPTAIGETEKPKENDINE